jgi:hypothetical protein
MTSKANVTYNDVRQMSKTDCSDRTKKDHEQRLNRGYLPTCKISCASQSETCIEVEYEQIKHEFTLVDRFLKGIRVSTVGLYSLFGGCKCVDNSHNK